MFCSIRFFGVDCWNEFKDFVHLDNYAGLTIVEAVIAFLYAMFLDVRHLVHSETAGQVSAFRVVLYSITVAISE